PEDIYRRTKEEGERRLERPFLEEVSTALAAGLDIVTGRRDADPARVAARALDGQARRARVRVVRLRHRLRLPDRRARRALHGELPRPDRGARPPKRRIVAEPR